MSTSCVATSARAVPRRGVARPHASGRAPPRRGARSIRRASSGGDDAISPSNDAPWWASLPEVHILVFNPETDEEALYTTSRRDADFAANDFVAFESLRDATRASVAVSDQMGDMPVVDTVDPRVVAFLADKCGYGVEVVPAGAPFDPPATLIDETSTPTRDDREHPPDELAISTADLQKYLSQGGDFEQDDAVDSEPEAETEASGSDLAALEAARRRAASVMRGALTAPARRVRGAVRDAAAAPARSVLTPMRRVQRAIRDAGGLPEGRERLDPLWDERTPMPSAAQAMYRALIVIAERRLSEEGTEGAEGGARDDA
jgi:hypothetical protein